MTIKMLIAAGVLAFGTVAAMAESPEIPGSPPKSGPPAVRSDTDPTGIGAGTRVTTGAASSMDASAVERSARDAGANSTASEPRSGPGAMPQQGEFGDSVGTTGTGPENQEAR